MPGGTAGRGLCRKGECSPDQLGAAFTLVLGAMPGLPGLLDRALL